MRHQPPRHVDDLEKLAHPKKIGSNPTSRPPSSSLTSSAPPSRRTASSTDDQLPVDPNQLFSNSEEQLAAMVTAFERIKCYSECLNQLSDEQYQRLAQALSAELRRIFLNALEKEALHHNPREQSDEDIDELERLMLFNPGEQEYQSVLKFLSENALSSSDAADALVVELLPSTLNKLTAALRKQLLHEEEASAPQFLDKFSDQDYQKLLEALMQQKPCYAATALPTDDLQQPWLFFLKDLEAKKNSVVSTHHDPHKKSARKSPDTVSQAEYHCVLQFLLANLSNTQERNALVKQLSPSTVEKFYRALQNQLVIEKSKITPKPIEKMDEEDDDAGACCAFYIAAIAAWCDKRNKEKVAKKAEKEAHIQEHTQSLLASSRSTDKAKRAHDVGTIVEGGATSMLSKWF